MEKKPYAAPVVKKVRLDIKNAVLAVCNSSPNFMDPKDSYNNLSCKQVPNCYS